MSRISDIAKSVTYQFECKKDALRQVQDGGVKVTFTVHPQEMPSALYMDPMGQRYVCALVPLNDDETPKQNGTEEPVSHTQGIPPVPAPAGTPHTQRQPDAPNSKKWSEMPYPQRAGIRCADSQYQRFIVGEYKVLASEAIQVCNDDAGCAAYILRKICGVKSRSEIKDGTEAARIFDETDTQFNMWLRFEAAAA